MSFENISNNARIPLKQFEVPVSLDNIGICMVGSKVVVLPEASDIVTEDSACV